MRYRRAAAKIALRGTTKHPVSTLDAPLNASRQPPPRYAALGARSRTSIRPSRSRTWKAGWADVAGPRRTDPSRRSKRDP
jgi:hypothetical protein